MSARLAGSFVAVLALGLLAGCRAGEGQKVVGYSGKTNNWVKVRDAGTYSLRGAGLQNVTYFLEADERLGFQRKEGTIFAIAGDNAPVELDKAAAKKAYWKFEKKDPYAKQK
jgi:hypothetical protein